MNNVDYGSTYTVLSNSNVNILPAAGYGFAGWSCNNGIGNKTAGQTFTMPDANVTCTAQWERITHRITFKTGNNEMGTQICNEGDTVTLNNVSGMSNIPVSSTYGWSFAGWASTYSTMTVTYTNADDYVCSADITLYGIWNRDVTAKYYNNATATSVTTSNYPQWYYNVYAGTAGVTNISLPALVNNTAYGWDAVGWVLNDASNTAVATDITLTAHLLAPATNVTPVYSALYTRTPQVTYNGNGSDGGTTNPTNCDEQKRNAGDASNNGTSSTATLASNGFTRDGYVFTGWNTAADGSGTPYAEGATYTFPNNAWASSNATTLYAQWQKNNYDITYDCNGGTVIGSNTTPVETSVTRTDAAQYYPTTTYSFETVDSVCERANYAPQSWNCSYTDSNNTSHTVTTGDTVQPYNVTCSAVWDNGQIYLRWNPNNGETIETPNMCTLGGNITNIQQPTRTGYTFNGWNLACLIPSTLSSANADAYAAKRLNGESDDTDGGATAETYGITEPGEWGVSWENGDKVTGVALCSQTNGVTFASTGTPDETGSGETKYCWCKATHYTANAGSQCALSSPAWVFYTDYGSACTYGCPSLCTYFIRYSSNFRAALFGDNVATP